MKKVLSIAGSDCSGGAGIQADLKTFAANGTYGMCVLAALTAQNTLGVTGIFEVSPSFVREQMDAVFSDVFPDAVKIGMVASGAIMESIAEGLKHWKAKHIVLDPVMVATSGSSLMNPEHVGDLKRLLIPLADVVTPNLGEAEVLCGFVIQNDEDLMRAAEAIADLGAKAVYIKGGHLADRADDYLYLAETQEGHWFRAERLETKNNHGTGCTLSSAFAVGLAKGLSLPEAAALAKAYVHGALADGFDIGAGNGPLNHLYQLFEKEGE